MPTAEQRQHYKVDLQNLQAQYDAYRAATAIGRRTPVPDHLAVSVAIFADAWQPVFGAARLAKDLQITKGYFYKLAERGRAKGRHYEQDTDREVDRLVQALDSAELEPKTVPAIVVGRATPRRVSVVVDVTDAEALSRFDAVYDLVRKEGGVRLALEAAARAVDPVGPIEVDRKEAHAFFDDLEACFLELEKGAAAPVDRAAREQLQVALKSIRETVSLAKRRF